MKSYVFVMAFLFVARFAQGQDLAKGDKTFGVEINSIGLFATDPLANSVVTLRGKYYVSDNLALRLFFNPGYTNTSSTTTTRGTSMATSNKVVYLGFGPGIQKNLARFDRFCIYAGADLSFSYRNTKTVDKNTVVDTTRASGSLGDYSNSAISVPNELEIGLLPFIGCSYRLSKHFFIGAEFGMGIYDALPYHLTDITTSRANKIVNPPQTQNIDYRGSFYFNSTNTATINLTYKF